MSINYFPHPADYWNTRENGWPLWVIENRNDLLSLCLHYHDLEDSWYKKWQDIRIIGFDSNPI